MRYAKILWATGVIAALAVGISFARAGATEPSWLSPSSVAVEKLGPYEEPFVPEHLENLGCTKVDYMNVGQVVHGCFISTAFGKLDALNDRFMTYGQDGELIELREYSQNQILLGWPGSASLLSLEVTGQGTYANLYGYAPAFIREDRSIAGVLRAKQLTGYPDLSLKSPSGAAMKVNYRTVAFSEGGNWLLLETTDGFARINGASLTAQYFAKSLASNSSYRDTQVAISKDGRYVAIVNAKTSYFRVFDLAQCSRTAPVITDCPSYNYGPQIAQFIPGLSRLQKIRFSTNNQISFMAAGSEGEHVYRVSPDGPLQYGLEYLALGDSFTSGEGAFDYIKQTNTEQNGCHHSSAAYPYLLRLRLYSVTAGNSVACSGAKIGDITPGNPSTYRGQIRGGSAYNQKTAQEIDSLLARYAPGVIPQKDFASHAQPRVISLGIGGNDIGFSKIMQECVGPRVTRGTPSPNTCYDTYEERVELQKRIQSQKSRLVSMLRTLKRTSPGSRVYIIGYPQIAIDTGNCARNVLLNTSELALSIELIHRLNATIHEAALEARAQYVDISDALNGYRLCEGKTRAVHGLTYGDDAGAKLKLGSFSAAVDFLGKESYHPNALGHELIAKAILEKTKRFTLWDVPMPAKNPDANFINRPQTGRPITISAAGDFVQTKLVSRGGSLALALDTSEYDLREGSINVTLGREEQAVSVGVVSGTPGAINGTVTLPSTVPTGIQPIAIIGDNINGDPVTIIDTVYIVVDPGDYDGDGVGNAQDTCPTITGQDDACESLPVVAPANTDYVSSRETGIDFTVPSHPNVLSAQARTLPAYKSVLSATTVKSPESTPQFRAQPEKASEIKAPQPFIVTYKVLLLMIVGWFIFILLIMLLFWLLKKGRRVMIPATA